MGVFDFSPVYFVRCVRFRPPILDTSPAQCVWEFWEDWEDWDVFSGSMLFAFH